MRVTRLDGGHFTSAAGIWRRGEDMERRVRFPIPAYLVEVGEERILVDTGLHPDAAADAARHYEGAESIGFFQLDQAAAIDRQVDLGSLTKVVLTHLHFDHAGGLALLPPTLPVVVQRREWEAGRDPAAIARNFFLPRDYEGIADQVVLVDGDHDLLGDGAVELLLTPGHTPGHQSVRIGDDLEVQLASAKRLRGLRDAGAAVLPGHDPDVLAPGPVAVG